MQKLYPLELRFSDLAWHVRWRAPLPISEPRPLAVPVDLALSAFSTTDDVGAFLRGHHIVEQAAEACCQRLYCRYQAFGHDTLAKHVNAIDAIGVEGPLLGAMRFLAKLRNDFAHTRAFSVSSDHVEGLMTRLAGSAFVGNARNWLIPDGMGNEVLFVEARPSQQLVAICLYMAGILEHHPLLQKIEGRTIRLADLPSASKALHGDG